MAGNASSGKLPPKGASGLPGGDAQVWPALVPTGQHSKVPPIPLMRPVTLIGSRQNAHLHLLSRQISKAHALVISSDNQVYVRDLASRTHVYVNGEEVREAYLKDGDLLKIGSFVFKFRAALDTHPNPQPDLTPIGQLEVAGGQFPLAVDQRVLLVGRRETCDVSLIEESVSTGHAVIFSMGGKRFVRDLGSRTGSWVNGRKERQAELKFGDTLKIGETSMRYQAAAEEITPPEVDEFEDLVGTAPLVDSSLGTEVAPTPLPYAFDTGSTKGRAGRAAAVDPLSAGPVDLDLDMEGDAPLKPGDTAVIPVAESTPAPRKPLPAIRDEIPARPARPAAPTPVPPPSAKSKKSVEAPLSVAPAAFIAPPARSTPPAPVTPVRLPPAPRPTVADAPIPIHFAEPAKPPVTPAQGVNTVGAEYAAPEHAAPTDHDDPLAGLDLSAAPDPSVEAGDEAIPFDFATASESHEHENNSVTPQAGLDDVLEDAAATGADGIEEQPTLDLPGFEAESHAAELPPVELEPELPLAPEPAANLLPVAEVPKPVVEGPAARRRGWFGFGRRREEPTSKPVPILPQIVASPPAPTSIPLEPEPPAAKPVADELDLSAFPTETGDDGLLPAESTTTAAERPIEDSFDFAEEIPVEQAATPEAPYETAAEHERGAVESAPASGVHAAHDPFDLSTALSSTLDPHVTAAAHDPLTDTRHDGEALASVPTHEEGVGVDAEVHDLDAAPEHEFVAEATANEEPSLTESQLLTELMGTTEPPASVEEDAFDLGAFEVPTSDSLAGGPVPSSPLPEAPAAEAPAPEFLNEPAADHIAEAGVAEHEYVLESPSVEALQFEEVPPVGPTTESAAAPLNAVPIEPSIAGLPSNGPDAFSAFDDLAEADTEAAEMQAVEAEALEFEPAELPAVQPLQPSPEAASAPAAFTEAMSEPEAQDAWAFDDLAEVESDDADSAELDFEATVAAPETQEPLDFGSESIAPVLAESLPPIVEPAPAGANDSTVPTLDEPVTATSEQQQPASDATPAPIETIVHTAPVDHTPVELPYNDFDAAAPSVVTEPTAVIEVLDPAEPTNESVLSVGESLGLPVNAELAHHDLLDGVFTESSHLSDSTFGRQFEEFAGDSPEPIVVNDIPDPAPVLLPESHVDAATEVPAILSEPDQIESLLGAASAVTPDSVSGGEQAAVDALTEPQTDESLINPDAVAQDLPHDATHDVSTSGLWTSPPAESRDDLPGEARLSDSVDEDPLIVSEEIINLSDLAPASHPPTEVQESSFSEADTLAPHADVDRLAGPEFTPSEAALDEEYLYPLDDEAVFDEPLLPALERGEQPPAPELASPDPETAEPDTAEHFATVEPLFEPAATPLEAAAAESAAFPEATVVPGVMAVPEADSATKDLSQHAPAAELPASELPAVEATLPAEDVKHEYSGVPAVDVTADDAAEAFDPTGWNEIGQEDSTGTAVTPDTTPDSEWNAEVPSTDAVIADPLLTLSSEESPVDAGATEELLATADAPIEPLLMTDEVIIEPTPAEPMADDASQGPAPVIDSVDTHAAEPSETHASLASTEPTTPHAAVGNDHLISVEALFAHWPSTEPVADLSRPVEAATPAPWELANETQPERAPAEESYLPGEAPAPVAETAADADGVHGWSENAAPSAQDATADQPVSDDTTPQHGTSHALSETPGLDSVWEVPAAELSAEPTDAGHHTGTPVSADEATDGYREESFIVEDVFEDPEFASANEPSPVIEPLPAVTPGTEATIEHASADVSPVSELSAEWSQPAQQASEIPTETAPVATPPGEAFTAHDAAGDMHVAEEAIDAWIMAAPEAAAGESQSGEQGVPASPATEVATPVTTAAPRDGSEDESIVEEFFYDDETKPASTETAVPEPEIDSVPAALTGSVTDAERSYDTATVSEQWEDLPATEVPAEPTAAWDAPFDLPHGEIPAAEVEPQTFAPEMVVEQPPLPDAAGMARIDPLDELLALGTGAGAAVTEYPAGLVGTDRVHSTAAEITSLDDLLAMGTSSSSPGAVPRSYPKESALANEVVEPATKSDPNQLSAELPQQQPVVGLGSFDLGTDQASFLGGLPLILHDTTALPTNFGQVGVDFDAPKPKPPAPAAAPVTTPSHDFESIDDEDNAESSGDGEMPVVAAPMRPPSSEPRKTLFSKESLKIPVPPGRGSRGNAETGKQPQVDLATPPGFEEAARVFGGLSVTGRTTDVFSQGFSSDLSNDPIFGKSLGGMPKDAPRRSQPTRPAVVVPDPQVAGMAERLVEDLGRGPVDRPAGEDELAVVPEGIDDISVKPLEEEIAPEPVALQPGIRRTTVDFGVVDAAAPVAGIDAAAARAQAERYANAASPGGSQDAFAGASHGHRGRGKAIAVMLVLMLLAMVASTVTIYTLLKKRFATEGVVQYENFGKLTAAEARELESEQRALLSTGQLQEVAKRIFRQSHPEGDFGFLDDVADFSRNAQPERARWSDQPPGQLVFRYEGDGESGDRARVKALLTALYTLNLDSKAAAEKADENYAKLKREYEAQQTRQEQIIAERKKLAAVRDAGPDEVAIKNLELAAATADKRWRAARDAAVTAEGEVKKAEAAVLAGSAPLSTASSGNAQSLPEDADLETLQKNLEASTARLESARAAAAEQAEASRKFLDAAVEQFQQSVNSVQGIMKENPELSNYVNGAQHLMETTQKLSGDLLDRQQKNYDHLVEVKRLIDARIELRKKELQDTDHEIKVFKDDLAMRERGYNAAQAQDLLTEAAQIRKEMDDLLGQIGKRKVQLEADGSLVALSGASDSLAREITSTQTQLELDRKQSEATLTELQQSLKNSSAIAKLPESQKAVADQLAAKAEAVNNARKAYLESQKGRVAESNAGLAMLEKQVKDATAQADQRRQLVARRANQQMTAEERERLEAAVAAKRASLDEALKFRSDAENQSFEAGKRLAEARGATAEARAAAEMLQAKTGEWELVRASVAQLGEQMKNVPVVRPFPREPVINAAVELSDPRPLYTAVSWGGIVVIFACLILAVALRGDKSQGTLPLTDRPHPYAGVTAPDRRSALV